MIKTNEIRLGNYFSTPNQPVFRVDIIDILTKNYVKVGQYINEQTHPITWYLADLKPIRLTEDIIFKLGFVDKGFGDWRKNRLYLSRESASHFVTNGFIIEIQFLHQLQNLYFAIHGEELVFLN